MNSLITFLKQKLIPSTLFHLLCQEDAPEN
jgi:hypothetical protein